MTPEQIRQMAYETYVWYNWITPQQVFTQQDIQNAFFAGWNERPVYDV
jgi:hypothetical protein